MLVSEQHYLLWKPCEFFSNASVVHINGGIGRLYPFTILRNTQKSVEIRPEKKKKKPKTDLPYGKL